MPAFTESRLLDAIREVRQRVTDLADGLTGTVVATMKAYRNADLDPRELLLPHGITADLLSTDLLDTLATMEQRLEQLEEEEEE